MAWGLDDLMNWARGVDNTLRGGGRSRPGGEATYRGIVQPLKLGSELSGFSQVQRGAGPEASNKDRLLALLALTGAMTGPGSADEIVAGGRALKEALSPEYAYGIHVSPKPNLKSIKAGSRVRGVPRYGGNFGDAERGHAYFFNTDNEKNLTELQKYVHEYITRLYSKAPRGTGPTTYLVRTPAKHISIDKNIGPVASKTRRRLKVVDSSGMSPARIQYDWMTDGRPYFENDPKKAIESLARLIAQNPKYKGKPLSSITDEFETYINKKFNDEIIKHGEYLRDLEKKSVTKKVVAKKKEMKKATP